MTKYRVVVTSKANDDIESIFNYIAYDLGAYQAASKLYDRITDAILSLSYFPYRIKAMNDTFVFGNVRKLSVDNYSILFVIKRDTVIVINVLYSSANIQLESVIALVPPCPGIMLSA